MLTDIEDDYFNVPTKYSLEQNYPNPFNPSTKIKYTVTKESFINLKIYNAVGQNVAELVNETKPAGIYEVEFSKGLIHQTLSSGIYFYQLQAGSFNDTKKMILIK